MKNDKRSHGLWEATAPEAPPTVALGGDLETEVAIVGAGYTGLSAALHLAKAGKRVVVLEAEEIGFGGSGRNVGLINAGLWLRPDDLKKTMGPVHGERVLSLLGGAPAEVFALAEQYGIDCELERNGTLHCAAGRSGFREIEERYRQWQAIGASVELLGAYETFERTGTRVYRGALLDRRAGTLQPLAYTRGLAGAAIREGAQIFTGTALVGWRQNGARTVLSTSHGEVTADAVIFAGNAYSVGPLAMVRNELTAMRYFNFATEPLPNDLRKAILPGKEGCWDTKMLLSSFRTDRTGRLIFGSFGVLKGTERNVHAGWARRALASLFPQLKDVAFEHEWFGTIGMTKDAVPRFHRFADNVVGISGYNGRGIAPGTVFGRTLAELLTGRITEADMPLPVTPFQEVSFRAGRELFYQLGSAACHLIGERI